MKQINVQINGYLEYINSILLTSKYNELTKPYIGYELMTTDVNEYTNAIKCFFEKHLNDPIYNYIEGLIPKGFTFSRPVELMLCLGDSRDFSMQYVPSDLCIQYCGGLSKIQETLKLLKEFESKIGYFAFFEKVKGYYNPSIEKAKRIIDKCPYISILEEEFGKEQNSYNYIISSLMVGNYGISFVHKENQKEDLFSVFSVDENSLSVPVLLHEYAHSFINPVTLKYLSIVTEYQTAYELLKPYKLAGFQSGYGDWHECVDEHLVRAMVIHLLQKCNFLDMAEELLKREWYYGYRYIPWIIEQYKYYDCNRELYPDFEAFYPELLKVFSNDISHIEK